MKIAINNTCLALSIIYGIRKDDGDAFAEMTEIFNRNLSKQEKVSR